MSDHLGELLGLLESSGAKLHALLLRLTLREDAAEELMQDLFVRLAGSRSFREARNAEAFAYTTAVRLAFDWRRSRKRKSALQLAEDPAIDERVEQQLEQSEEVAQVLDAMEQLAAADCEILVARFLEQQSYETIAEARGVSAHQVRAQCHKAMTRLRKLLHVEPPVRHVPQKESPHADA